MLSTKPPRRGTAEHPAVIRVQTEERARQISAICTKRNWKIIAGIEPDKPEDVSDVRALLRYEGNASSADVGRNDLCPCGSGKKYKKCCLPLEESAIDTLLQKNNVASETNISCEHCALLEELFITGSDIPRTDIDRIVRRGADIVSHLADIVEDENVWDAREPVCWAAVHATYILGAIGEDECLEPLANALLLASEYGCEEVTEEISSMFASFGTRALPWLWPIANDVSLNWLPRCLCFDAIAEIVQECPEADEALDRLAEIMEDTSEEMFVRAMAGCALLDCTPERYRQALLAFARGQEESDESEYRMFDVDCVRLRYAEPDFQPPPPLYWMEFYSDASIAERRKMRARAERSQRWLQKLWDVFWSPVELWWIDFLFTRKLKAFEVKHRRKIAALDAAERAVNFKENDGMDS